jgi:hypothetical protein
MKHKIYIIGFLVLLTFGCQRKISITIPVAEQKLVLNCLFNSTDSFVAFVTRTVSPLDSSFLTYDSAVVSLYRNNILVDPKLKYDKGNSSFYSSIIPQANDVYIMTVRRDGFLDNDITATAKLPNQASINSLSFKDSTVTDLDTLYGEIRFKLNDLPGRDNYRLKLYYYDDLENKFILIKYKSGSLPLNNNAAIIKSYERIFNDDLFEGKTQEFVLRIPSGIYFMQQPPNVGKSKFLVELATMSDDYYKYLKSLNDFQNQTRTSSFNTQPQLYSNTVGGLGIFAGYTFTRDTVGN